MAKENHLGFLLLRISYHNDKEAFARFFSYYHARLIRFALLFLKSHQDAEDVVSEVMIKILKRREKLTEIKNFEAYLYQAVKHQALNVLKKQQLRGYYTFELPDDVITDGYIQPYDTILADELRNLITTVVEKLPPKRRMVYKMVKDDGLKIKEVAQLLDLADKTVKKHLELAIRSLREVVEMYNAEKKDKTPVIHLKSKAVMFLILMSTLLIF